MAGKKWPITPGKAYYVDTRKTNTPHTVGLTTVYTVVNVPKTWENVIKLMS